MSFQPVNLRLVIDSQIVTFYPDSANEGLNQLRQAVEKILKEQGMKQDFLVGHTRVSLESKA